MSDTGESSITAEYERDLWRSMQETRDRDSRQQLIKHYMPLANSIAANLYTQRADNDAEFGDYLHYAYTGLIESIDRYIPFGDAAFSTYAGYRIRGSVLSGIQTLSERKEQAAFRAQVRRSRVSSLCEDGPASGPRALFEEMVELAVGLALGYMLEDSGVFQDKNAALGDTTYKATHIAELYQRLQLAVAELPEREQLLIRYHYYHHVSFDHISEILDIGKSRVSQLHKRALEHIRKSMMNLRDLDDFY